MPEPLEESFITQEAQRLQDIEKRVLHGISPGLEQPTLGHFLTALFLGAQPLPTIGGIIGEETLSKVIKKLLPNHPGIQAVAELVGGIGGALVGDPASLGGKSTEEVTQLLGTQAVQSELQTAGKEAPARMYKRAQQILGTTGKKDTDEKLSLFEKILDKTHSPPIALINSTLMNPRISIQKLLTDTLFLPIQQAFKGISVANKYGTQAGAKTTVAALWAYRQAGKDALKYAMKTFSENRPVFQENVLGLMDKGTYAVEDETFSNSTASHAWRFLGSIMGVGRKSVMSADQFAKAIAYRAELNTNAMIAGLDEAHKSGLVGGAANHFAELYSEHLVNNPPNWLYEKAVQNMFKLTFTDDSKITKAVTQLANSTPLGRWFVPYIRTPINLAKEGFKMSPLGIFQGDIWQNTDKIAQGTALARWGAGMLIYDWIGNEVEKGNITGDGPSGKIREVWPGAKHPRSIKIGDNWYGYEHLGPFAEVLSLAADSREIYNASKEPDIQGKVMDTIGKVLSDQVTHLPFLQEVYNTMHALDSWKEGGEESAAKAWIARATTGFIPAPVRMTAQIEDPKIREAKTLIDKWKENIPGYSQTLPPHTDHFGNDQYHPIGYDSNAPQSKTSLLLNQINPIPSYPDTKFDEVDKEAQRLNYMWNKSPEFWWKSRGGQNDPENPPIPLSPQQQYEWSQYTGHQVTMMGRNQHDQLQWLINTPMYKKLSDPDKKNQWEATHAGYLEMGRKYIGQKYPNLNQQQIQSEIKEFNTGTSE